ncbi:hypothetical protein [Escherichia fergusonii]|uniref:hypothetical protein n=1 Tax=Escherichia fergusonii TaxID=564 RepID=UPI0015EFD6AC|nr:hypothetical protein [Escherichia fergusonii]QMI37470.1 hypothetical protein HVY08_09120 [Escherichia fergusonii]QMI41534.1 hypothetical protein HVY07_09120 [Escherichia fergusonii]
MSQEYCIAAMDELKVKEAARVRVYYAGCGANALSGPQNPQIQLIAPLVGLISVAHQAITPDL